MSVASPRARRALSFLLSFLLIVAPVPAAFAAEPVAVPDGSPDAITSLHGNEASGWFGHDIAVDGEILAVGIPGATSFAGEVAIYRKTAAGLVYDTTVVAPDSATQSTLARFGHAVDVSGDALLVGSPGANSGDGKSYFFRESGGTWSLETSVSGFPARNGEAGTAVAIDGAHAVIGEPGTNAGLGYVRFIQDSGSGWVQTGGFNGGSPDERCGDSVDISGIWAVSGSPRYGNTLGRARVYRWVGASWVGGTTINGASGDYLGTAVGTDGTTIVASAPGDDVGGVNTGQVRAYTTGMVPRIAINSTDPVTNGYFGNALDLNNGVLVVTEPGHASGTGRISVLTGSLNAWTRTADFLRPAASTGDYFADSVASDGSIVFGSDYDDATMAPAGGAVFEFSTGWFTTTEETTLTVPAPGVLGNDWDDDADPLEAYLVTSTSDGTITVDTDGGFTYIPDVDFDGYDSFTYRTYDGSTYSTPTVASIYVKNVNDAPHFVQSSPTTVTCSEDNNPTPFALTLDVADPDSQDEILWGIRYQASHGTASVSGTGLTKMISYTPDANYYGTDSFEIRVNDLARVYDYMVVDVIIDPVNDAPTFNLRTPYNTSEDAGPITAPGWATAISPGGWMETTQTLVANTTNNNPALFSVEPSISVTGTLTFESAPNAYGSATVWYSITDTPGTPGSLTTTKTTTINVAPVNDAPTGNPDFYMTEEDEPIMVGPAGILGNDTDIEGPSDTPYWGPLESYLYSDVSNGSLYFFDNGSFIYSPDEGWSGVDEFVYRAWDGDLYSGPTTVTIDVASVNDEPIIDQGGTIATTVAEDSSVEVTLTAEDFDGDPLVWTIATQPADGMASVTSSSTTGVVTYTPDPDYNGPDSVTVQVSDGMGGTDLIVIEIDVTPVNDAPVAPDIEFDTVEDGLFILPPPGLLLIASDVDGDPLTLWDVSSPTPGTWQSIGWGSAGQLHFEPAPDYNGDSTVFYVVRDSTGALSAPGTITFHIAPANDAPTATGDAFSGTEDESFVSATSVLANDGDIDGDTLMAVLDTPAAGGLVLLQPDGTFYYDPFTDFNGVDSFTYRAFDGESYSNPATVTITLSPAEDDPVIDQGALSWLTTAEDTTLTVTFSATDPDGDLLAWSIVDQADEGIATCTSLGTSTTVTYVPDPDHNGDDAFSVAVTDITGRSDVIAVHVDVTPVNDAPTCIDQSYETPEDTPLVVVAPGLLEGAGDIDGDPLVVGAVMIPMLDIHGLLLPPMPDGSFIYLPDPDYNGPGVFRYQVWDGDLTSTAATVTITVTPVNDQPSFTPGGPVTVPEDTGDVTIDGWVAAIDPGAPNETQTVSFQLSNDNEALFSSQPAISPTGTLTFATAPDMNGTATVMATVTDDDTCGGDALTSDPVTFTIEVTPVNDAPVSYDDAYEVAEDTTLTVAAPGVLDNDTDIDGDMLTASLETSPTHGVLSLNADGSFDYRPDADYFGPDAFSYRSRDASLSSEPATVTITVTPVNDAPVAIGDAFTLDEDTTLEIEAPGLLGNDTDIENDQLTSVLATDAVHGTLSLAENGSFTYTPEPGWSGFDMFAYRAWDGDLFSEPVEVALAVRSVDTTYTPVEGRTRFHTAIAASQMAFPAGADTVVIATAFNWPDALAGSGLAGAVDGPILLTHTDEVPDYTLDEIDRLGASKAYVLGGEAAASDDVIDALEAKLGAGNVVRIGGADRYETAQLVAAEMIAQLGSAWDHQALIATGRDFPDAIAASPMSTSAHWPVFLVRPSGVTTPVASELATAGVEHAIVLGGNASVLADAEANLATEGVSSERVSGSDRYSTSIAIAEYGAAHAGLSWDVLGFATGEDFPDALAGGVTCAGRGGVMVLNPSNSVNDSLRRALTDHRSEIDEVLYFGGTAAISQGVRDVVRNILR